jgi:hypothetical protein
MHPMQPIAELALWAAKNTAHNLRFIPDDRLDWKPAPTAKSALEIVQHVCGALRNMRPLLTGGEWTPNPPPMPADRLGAEALLLATAEDYAAGLLAMPLELMSQERIVFARRWSLTIGHAVTRPVVDLIHHHGQIAYLQTLLGDEAMHFFEAGT